LALLALVSLCIVGGAVSVALVNAEEDEGDEARALAALTELGARLKWDVTPAGKELVGVDLTRTKVKDGDLKVLAAFKELRELTLTDTAVTGATCKELAGLAKLQTLRLNGAALSDDGMKGVAALTTLTKLTIGWSKVGD